MAIESSLKSGSFFLQMVLDQVGSGGKKKKKNDLYLNLTHYTNMNSKWILVLRLKHKTMKLLEENIREDL